MLPAPSPKQHLLFLDLETYWDQDYSLQKMPTPNYILDPRWELQAVAVKADDGPHQIVEGPDFGKWLAQYPAEITTTVTFNALFDNSAIAWRYGYVPHTMIDAMGMARALLGHEIAQFSLKFLSDFMGLPPKGELMTKGLRLDQIKAMGLWPQFCQYAIRDNMNAEQIFLKLYPQFPRSERRIMDMVLRCCVEPRFLVDVPMLEQHLEEVRAAKEQLLQDANNIDPKIIMSTPKFKAALEARGIDVAMKVSPTTGKETPAFAKTDEFMEELQEHPDTIVAAMAAARIGLKSTLEETRTEKLLSIASLPWAGADDQKIAHRALAQVFDPNFAPVEHITVPLMPIPLRYGGAHTHRLSGEWKMNMQNMPTVRGSKGKSKLRQSLIAPPGHTVVTCDLSQIEARLVAWICGCPTLLEEFAKYSKGDKTFDPYNRFAGAVFGRPVNRKLVGTLDEIMGFIGKTGILGLGYGCGEENFDNMVTKSARKDGLDISQIYTRDIGNKAVQSYRKRYFEIPRGWRVLDNMLSSAWLSGSAQAKFGPCMISYGNVLLPSGLSLRYADPGQRIGEDGRTEFRYRYGKFWHKIYGAKFLENIVQALARIVVMNAALRIRDRGFGTVNPRDYFFNLQGHDELVFIVRNDQLDAAKKIILEEMRRPPSWAPDAPIDAELGEGASYGAAK